MSANWPNVKVIVTLLFSMMNLFVRSIELQMDLINDSGSTIKLEPGHSLLMTIDLTYYSQVQQTYTYGVDWALRFYTLTSSQLSGSTDCTLEYPTSQLITLPSDLTYSSTSTINIFQEFKLRLYNYQTSDVVVLPGIWCKTTDFVSQFSGSTRIPVTYSITAPSRAIYGTSSMFFIALNQNKLANYLLPFNMPQSDGLFFDQINKEIPFPTPASQTGQPFDSTFWNDATTVLIPYIPFFSFCNGFGRHIMLNEVFESNEYCKKVTPEDTKTVSYFPASGFDPTADSCYASIQCKYEEDFDQQYKGTMWYQPSSDEVIFLSTDPISLQDFISNEKDSSSTYQNSIINNDNTLIKIPITADGADTSKHPTKVDSNTKRIISGNIVVSDYQDNLPFGSNTYELIIKLDPMGYSDLVNFFQFDKIVYAILFIFLSLIPVLIVSVVWLFNRLISPNKYKPPLKIWKTIQIAFWPAFEGNFFGIIPSFLVVIFVYLLQNQGSLFSNSSIYYQYDKGTVTLEQEIQIKRGRTGLILSLVGLFFIYYGSCLLIPTPTKEQEDTIKIFLQKQLQDKSNLELKDFNEFHKPSRKSRKERNSNPDQSAIPFTQNANNNSGNNHRRNKTSILGNQNKDNTPINGKDGGRDEDQTKIVEDENQEGEELEEKNSDDKGSVDSYSSIPPSPSEKNWKPHSDDEEENLKEAEGEEEEEEFEITQVFIFKRYHFFVVCLLSSIVFLALLEFSYTDSFKEYLDAYIFLLFLIEAIFITILQEFILKESLLVYPISASLETIQFIMSIAAEDFIQFIKLYLLRMLAVILYRSYLDPVIANKQIYKIKFVQWLLSFSQTHRILPASFILLLQRQVKPNEFEENLKNYIGVGEGGGGILLSAGSKTLEQVLNQLLTYASKMHSIFTKPCALLLILIFSQENKIPDQYSIRQQDFTSYLIFATIIIFPQIMIDVLVLNSLEVLYDIKLYDYFSYCKYKYENRGVAWIGQNYVKDRTIDINFRSLDNMCFSQQFYFVGSITIAGVIFLVLGVSIMIRQEYIFFSDPVIYAVYPFLYFIIMPAQKLLTWLWLKVDVWKLKVQDKTVQPLTSIEDVLNQERDSIEQIMEEDEIREHFLKCNKEWLIKNMKEFLTPESFLDNNEYLLNEVYRQLLDDQKKEEKEIRRLHMQQIKKEQNEKKGVVSQTPRSLAKSMIPDKAEKKGAIEVEKNMIYINPGTQEFSVLVKLIQIWYYRAKQVSFLRELVKSIKDSKIQPKCIVCEIDIELSVVEMENINILIAQFKVQNAARPFNKYQWMHFYERNQRFQTLCIDCEYKKKKAIFKASLNQQTNQLAGIMEPYNQNANNATISAGSQIGDQNEKKQVNHHHDVADRDIKVYKKIILFWFWKARSRLLVKQLNSTPPPPTSHPNSSIQIRRKKINKY